MARVKTQYVCQNCGASHVKWAGRCDACGEWNTLVEETLGDATPRGLGVGKGRALRTVSLAGVSEQPPRLVTGIAEYDRVCGGGLVPGSAILIGGDPGIGKSTLLLQAVCHLSGRVDTLYVSGEESVDQLRMRAYRLGLADASVSLAAATNVRDIAASMEDMKKSTVVVIDSIQTMYVDTLDSAPGTVAQVRASAQALIRVAKQRGVVLLLVGHVTKDGQIAGPRVLEHMVDTVLYFEGDRGHQFRILRAVKNRFGPTDEIGVFEMTDRGLTEVANPSSLFLGHREHPVSGTAVFAGIEGTRPLLVEIQALVAPSPFAAPRRQAVGWDNNRLAMLLAVLEARCGLIFAGHDVYLNIAGGLRINEPGADLAAAAALASARLQPSFPAELVCFGEVGLTGEIRPVSQSANRLKESAKLGFHRAWLPAGRNQVQAEGITSEAMPDLGHLLTTLRADSI